MTGVRVRVSQGRRSACKVRRGRDTISVLSVLSALSTFSFSADAQECPAAPSIPAYSHNDYDNSRPLYDALALGYRGVEADVVLEDGKLLVAHSRKETDTSRTVERLYLEPLRELVRRCGRVYPDTTSFLLNIESKDEGLAPYLALRQVLLGYRDILSTETDRGDVSRAIRVVLVGWHAPLDEMVADSVRVAKVQGWISHAGVRLPEGPDELVGLLSLNYGRTLRWRGRGLMPPADGKVLSRVARARQDFPGIPIRAFNIPPDPKIYQLLYDAGVDVIGTEKLQKTREILCRLQPDRLAGCARSR